MAASIKIERSILFARIFVATVFIVAFLQIGCDSGSSFSGTFKGDHIEKDFVSGEATLKVEELAELMQNGTSITGSYTRILTPLRYNNCSGSVKASITCTLSGENIARCTFPQYAEKEFHCEQPPLSIYSSAIGCGRASVDCVPFSATLKNSGQRILIEIPEFVKEGIFFEARSWEMNRQ